MFFLFNILFGCSKKFISEFRIRLKVNLYHTLLILLSGTLIFIWRLCKVREKSLIKVLKCQRTNLYSLVWISFRLTRDWMTRTFVRTEFCTTKFKEYYLIFSCAAAQHVIICIFFCLFFHIGLDFLEWFEKSEIFWCKRCLKVLRNYCMDQYLFWAYMAL